MPRLRPAPWCILFLIILFVSTRAQTQTRIQRLKTQVSDATDDASRLKAILAFCDEWESYSPDTLKKYSTLAKQHLSSPKDQRSQLLTDYYHAVWLFQVNKLDSAMTMTDAVLKGYKASFSYDEMYVKMYGLRGNILLRTARMNDLMSHNFDLIKLAEQNKDTLGIARATLGIGNVNLRLKKYDEALSWYHRALALMPNPVYKRKLSFIFNNLAITFYHLANEDSAIYYVRQGVRYSREDENLTNHANALFVYGGLMSEFNHLKEAEEGFKQAVEVRKKIGDIYYLINDMGQLAFFYANNNEPQKGIALCKEGLDLAEKNGRSFSNLTSLYEVLGKNYQAAGDYRNYSETLEKMLEMKDSIYKINSAEAIAEIQGKYDLQKKENTIIQQELALIKKNYWLYGSLLLTVFAIILGYILFRNYRKKQKLRSNIAVRDAEEKERKRIAADLHDSLGAYAASIASNIEHIAPQTSAQSSIALGELRSNSQLIVSQLSDTIWALKKESLSMTALSDRIKVFIHKLQPSYPAITFDVFENISSDHKLSSVQAFHLFQVIQEAINNALKHSGCSHIVVQIDSAAEWRVTISDNGSGISTNINGEGNGLSNMKSRSKESGWNIQWQSNTPSGTSVMIEPTTN